MTYPDDDSNNELRVDPLTGELIGNRPQAMPYFGGYQDAPVSSSTGYVPSGASTPVLVSGGGGQKAAVSRLLLVLSVVVILALVGVGTYFLFTTNNSTTTTANRSTATRTPRTTPTTPSKPSATSSAIPALTPGWQGVSISDPGVAYDVPGDWLVEPQVLAGFESPDGLPVALMHTVSTYKHNACASAPGSYRARAGFMSVGDVDPFRGARSAAKIWAGGAIEKDPKDPSIPEPTVTETEIHAGAKAWLASVIVTASPGSSCPAPQVKVTTVAFKPRPEADTAMFVLYSDQGVDGALPAEIESKIVASLRSV